MLLQISWKGIRAQKKSCDSPPFFDTLNFNLYTNAPVYYSPEGLGQFFYFNTRKSLSHQYTNILLFIYKSRSVASRNIWQPNPQCGALHMNLPPRTLYYTSERFYCRIHCQSRKQSQPTFVFLLWRRKLSHRQLVYTSNTFFSKFRKLGLWDL